VLSSFNGQMGNDGGSIPSRREMVMLRKKIFSDGDSVTEQGRTKWAVCALKKEKFGDTIVADLLGNLFDKRNIIRALVEQSLPPQFSHIQTMKDLVEVKFMLNTDVSGDHQMGASLGNFVAPFQCPITQRAACGRYGFSAVKVCGHAFSDKGLLKSKLFENQNNCFVCGASYTKDDVLPLNPNEEQLEVMKRRLEAFTLEKQALKLLKKEEKKKKRESDNQDGKDPKKRKVEKKTHNTKIDGPIVHNSGTIKKAMKHASDVHDKKKKASETYQSIFAPPSDGQPFRPNLTGTYRR